jgi:hypothetical protein
LISHPWLNRLLGDRRLPNRSGSCRVSSGNAVLHGPIVLRLARTVHTVRICLRISRVVS